MSANAQPRLLVTGDLDLLISRSLDGDLPAEEERELKELLAADPAARARYEAMAALVGGLEALPEPETPFALATRINSQLEDDTKGLAASLHRFGFYLRPATLGVVAAGIVTVAITMTVMSPRKPAATVAAVKPQAAPATDGGRVTVYLGESAKKDAAVAAPAAPAPAGEKGAGAPSATRPFEAKPARREPALAASADAEKAKEEQAFAPEREAGAVAAVAPAPPMARGSVESNVATQKSAVAESSRPRAAAPAAAGPVRFATVEVVGKSATSLRLAAPARLESFSGPFDGSYRLGLNASGGVVDVVRLFGGSGAEPPALQDRLRSLSFVPADSARAAGSVDVRVRLP